MRLQTAPKSTPDSKPMRWSSFHSAAECSPTDCGPALPRPPADVRIMHQLPNRADTPLDQSLAMLPAQNQLSWPPDPFSSFQPSRAPGSSRAACSTRPSICAACSTSTICRATAAGGCCARWNRSSGTRRREAAAACDVTIASGLQRRSNSAIWIALSAAPLRRLSLLTNSARPRSPGTPGSCRTRPT